MADQQKPAPSDDDVLARPSDFTVDQVIAALGRAPQARVEQAKIAESEGKNRAGILDFQAQPPTVEQALRSEDGVERYTSAGWQERARWLTVEGHAVTRHAVVGALHGSAAHELFSQQQVEQRLQRFLTTPECDLP